MILWKILGEFKFQSFDFLSSLQFLLQKADEKMTPLKMTSPRAMLSESEEVSTLIK